jgi:hypothetical protein
MRDQHLPQIVLFFIETPSGRTGEEDTDRQLMVCGFIFNAIE